MIRVVIPFHLQTLAQIGAEVALEVPSPITARAVIRALEQKHPTLKGAIIDHYSGQRRPKVRFFACQQDISHESMDEPLPPEIAEGQEAFLIIGAISGG